MLSPPFARHRVMWWLIKRSQPSICIALLIVASLIALSKSTFAIPPFGTSLAGLCTASHSLVRFPRGYGPQPLYSAEVSISCAGSKLSESIKRFGVRRVELVQTADLPPSAGESFSFRVNNVDIYAKGANMIPLHVFPVQETGARYQSFLDSAVAANMNCIRIVRASSAALPNLTSLKWGGGRYPIEDFYDLCNQYGLLVWHDLMFACSLYPADPGFLSNVAAEVKYQLRRLSRHPCILIYTYNNENEELLHNDWLKVGADKERLLLDYSRLFCDTIHPLVLLHAPNVPTMPSSPSNGHNRWGNPAQPDRGDMHYWGVWHGTA